MKYQAVPLGELCSVSTGMPATRARAVVDDVPPRHVRMLQPRALHRGRIIDDELSHDVVYRVKDEFFMREGDVVLKLATPHDCALVDAAHAGVLATSFAVIARKKENAPIDMGYLALFLGSRQGNQRLASLSKGGTLPMLTRRAIAEFPVVLPPLETQEHLARLSEALRARCDEYRTLIALDEELLDSLFVKTVWGE